MNAASWIVLFVIAVAFALAVLRIFKGKHTGCCGGCNGCNKTACAKSGCTKCRTQPPNRLFSCRCVSVSEQLNFGPTAEPLLKDFRKLTVLLDGG